MKPDSTIIDIWEAWLDGDISEARSAELLERLDADQELRKELAGHIAMHGALAAATETHPNWLSLFADIEDTAEQSQGDRSFEITTMERIDSNREKPTWTKIFRITPFALAAGIAIAVFLKIDRPGDQPSSPPVTDVDKEETLPVAVVTGSGGESKFEDGMFLPPGNITEKEGWLAVQTLSGVSLTLTAPFDIRLIDPDRIHVNEGQVRAFVPDGAEGFILESPGFEIIDLGTEFATTVNPDGTGTCKVFEGKADVSFLDSLGSSSATRRLNAGEEVHILPSERSMKPKQEPARAYAEMKIPPKPPLVLSTSYASDVLALEPSDYWKFENMDEGRIPNEVPGRPPIVAFGDVHLETESTGNRSGRLKYRKNNGAFVAEFNSKQNLSDNFTVAMFTQFDWLQNYTLFASSRWDDHDPSVPRGNQFILKAYASFEQSGIQGTGLYSVFRDKPSWNGGTEIFGNQLLRPKFWHHVALTRNPSEVILYLDGKIVARNPVDSIPINFDHLYIGRSDSPNRPPEFLERGLIGNVDEVVIFDRELSPAEIAILAEGKAE